MISVNTEASLGWGPRASSDVLDAAGRLLAHQLLADAEQVAHRPCPPRRVSHHVTILEMNGDSYRLAQSRVRKTQANA